jgi:16S rRNA (guanine527-N7)-methyltransferase
MELSALPIMLANAKYCTRDVDGRCMLENMLSSAVIQKFEIYEKLLTQWNRRTGLVQVETIPEFTQRHLEDSLQVIPILYEQYLRAAADSSLNINVNLDSLQVHKSPYAQMNYSLSSFNHMLSLIKDLAILDVGSGAGFPGLVLAICGFNNIVLCESNVKKCLFLQEVARQTKCNVRILNVRVETVSDKFDCIVSRACTDLDGLLKIVSNLPLTGKGFAVFHKGRSWKHELFTALKYWHFQCRIYESMTSPDSMILSISHLNPQL